ncbi:MAG: GNAT family N-acetyltransferase [Candidatus Bathyarchaeia archaeon]
MASISHKSAAFTNLAFKLISMLAHYAYKYNTIQITPYYWLTRNSLGSSSRIVSIKDLVIRCIENGDIPEILKFHKRLEPKNCNRGIVGIIHGSLASCSFFGSGLVLPPIFDVPLYFDQSSLYIYGIYVISTFRNQGIGKKLLASIPTFCSQDVKRFYLSVYVKNKRAINLYLKVGFHEMGTVIVVKIIGFRFCFITGNTKDYENNLKRILRLIPCIKLPPKIRDIIFKLHLSTSPDLFCSSSG